MPEINEVLRDEDVSLDVLRDKVVAVIGYGVQGGPQALCMRDSGLKVIVGAGNGNDTLIGTGPCRMALTSCR